MSDPLSKSYDSLKEREEILRLYVEYTPAATAMCDRDMNYLAYSRRWVTDYNLPEENHVGRCHYDVFEVIPDRWREEHRRCFQGEVINNEEEPFPRADGSIDWVRRNIHPWRNSEGEIGGLIMFTEVITERKRAEEALREREAQLLRAQKMEAIGTLAGGVAHDFNNLLMGIQGRISLMLLEPGTPEFHMDHLQGIENHIQNAADLTRQLLGIARAGKYNVRATNINELVDQTASMFSRTRKELILHRRYDPDAWTVEVDRGQMEQVLLNLLVNAWQAMPRGGDIFIRSENVMLEEEAVKPYATPPGRYVRITVTDTGIGMESDILDRLFDPFFTTKEKERGTGMGLASAYGIIKHHRGFIRVVSEKDNGSTFSIYLPASERVVEDEAKAERSIRRGEGAILLVDDEEMILEVGELLLERLGYQVITARSGIEAVDCLKRRRGVDLVILDMIMPGMDGGDTFDAIKKMNPQQKMILSSGYSADGLADKILRRGCDGFLQKPFSIQSLSAILNDVLERTG